MVARTREGVLNALFAQLQTAGTVFATYSRRWLDWQDDPQAQPPPLPLLVQWEDPDGEVITFSGRGIPPTRTWNLHLLVYAKIAPTYALGVPGATPGASVVNPLIDAIETALNPDNDSDPKQGQLTLGGLVIDCRIEGQVIKVLGDRDPSGLCSAIVPIKILVQ